MSRLILASLLALHAVSANAQLIVLPAPPMTVADCRAGTVWMIGPNGLPTCRVPAPPPPPPPPLGSYVYGVSASRVSCQGSDNCTQVLYLTFKAKGQGENIVWSASYTTTTPWGVDLASILSLPYASAMVQPMQYFKSRGCSVASEDGGALAITNDAYGFNLGPVLMLTQTIGGYIEYANYAVCPGPIAF